MPPEEINRTVRYHRTRAGLSHKDLAALAGIGKTALFDIEHGKPTVQLQTLQRILAALNISLRLDSPFMDADQAETP